jgi:exosortase/archaeosortase family protein
MRRSLQILILLVSLAVVAPADATIIDFIAENITFELPAPDPATIARLQLDAPGPGPGQAVLSGHMLWDTELGQRLTPYGQMFTVSGIGDWQANSRWNAYFPQRQDAGIVIEGIVASATPSPSDGVVGHGYSYIGLELPLGQTLDTAQPAVYDAREVSGMSWEATHSVRFNVGADGGYFRVGVPLPRMIRPSEAIGGALRRLSPPLQYVTAAGATGLLQLIGTPATLRPGVGAYGEYQAYIDLRNVTIQVMEGCNGLGFLLTLGLGALLLAPQIRRGGWLLLAVLPVALGANAVRVALLSVGVEQWGVDFVRGPTLTHELVGWMTWSLALVALMGLAMLMARTRLRFERK